MRRGKGRCSYVIWVGKASLRRRHWRKNLGKGSEPCGYLGKGHSGRGTGKCKDREVGLCQASSRNSKETGAERAGGSRRKGGQAENWEQEGPGNQFTKDLVSCCKDTGLYGESLKDFRQRSNMV